MPATGAFSGHHNLNVVHSKYSSLHSFSNTPPKGVGAQSGAQGEQTAPFGSELGIVIDAWPKLPASIQRAILAMVKHEAAAADEKEEQNG